MADVRPFRGLLFNSQMVGQMSDVTCPPYDVISSQLQNDLYLRSPYNAVRLEAGQTYATDTPDNDRYTRAADTLQQWIRDRILVRDEAPAYYLIRHEFKYSGRYKSRLGLLAAVRVVDYERGEILPHEYTQQSAKDDRLALMNACQANFSHIMLLYRDREKAISNIFEQVLTGHPTLSFSDCTGSSYTIWAITDSSTTGIIKKLMSYKELYIADGHHRYETALAYRNGQMSKARQGDAGHNFIMSYLVDFEDPGLVVLPYHRVIGGLTAKLEASLKSRIDLVFKSEPSSTNPKQSLENLLAEIEARGKQELIMGIATPENERGHLMTIRPEVLKRGRGPIASFEAWSLEEEVLKPVLGDSLDRHVAWIHDPHEAIACLRDGWHQATFLLKSLPMDLFEAIVSQGDRLPRKSTFFYPKLPTGLAMHLLQDSPGS